MKKSARRIIIFFVLLVLALLFVSAFPAGKTQDEIIDMLRQELALTGKENTAIACIGEFTRDKDVLLWFTIQTQQETDYRAVNCQLDAEGRYQMVSIEKPMTYAQDIVHVIWNAEDVFLVNDPACRSVVYKYASGDTASTIELVASDIPYVFRLDYGSAASCGFYDAAGNEIR